MDKSKARCCAFDKAVNLLAFKDRTIQEIHHKLEEKGYSSSEIEDTIDRLMYYGYLNDENYAFSYIKDNASKKGKKLIINELGHKGVDRSIIEEVVREVDIDEVTSIENTMRRRYSGVDFKDERMARKIIGYFLRRGYSYENIISCLHKNIVES